MYDDNFGEQIRGWISNSSNGKQTSADNERQLKTWLHENHCDLKILALFLVIYWKLRGLWDAMCAIYRCLIPSSLYQPGSNSVMRNIIPNNSFKIHFSSVMSDVRSTPQVSAWIWSPIKTFIRLFSRDCFGFVNACFWMLLFFFSCCVFVLDFGKDDKCGKSDGSSSTLLIVCKCSNLLQR